MSEQIENLIRIKLLGEGAFGEVSLYKHKYTSELYAGKLINKLELKKGVLKYLQSEIDILKKLNHSNIIKVKDVIDKKDKLLIFMEYCNGESLSKCLYKYKDINNSEGFPEEIIQYLMKQIVDAVIYLHDKNIIHRDLKLDNIMVHFDNEKDRINFNIMKAKIKIIDFGISKVLPSKNGFTNSCVGTLYYMPPEILLRLKNKEKCEKIIGYGKEADIWSLGCICYELLRAKKVFDSDEYDDLVEKITIGEYKLPKTVSQEYISFLNAMLKFDGKNRKTAKELLQYDFLTKNVKDFKKRNENNIKESNEYKELRNSFNSFKERCSQINYKKYNSFEQKPIPEESINNNQSSINKEKIIGKSFSFGGGYSFYGQPMFDNSTQTQNQQMDNNFPLNNNFNQMPINRFYSNEINRNFNNNIFNINNNQDINDDLNEDNPPLRQYNSEQINQKKHYDCVIY